MGTLDVAKVAEAFGIVGSCRPDQVAISDADPAGCESDGEFVATAMPELRSAAFEPTLMIAEDVRFITVSSYARQSVDYRRLATAATSEIRPLFSARPKRSTTMM